MLTWLTVAYDDDSGRVVGGNEDGGDGGRDYDGGGVNVNVCADGSGGVGDGGRSSFHPDMHGLFFSF